jgi:hypothetical protein
MSNDNSHEDEHDCRPGLLGGAVHLLEHALTHAKGSQQAIIIIALDAKTSEAHVVDNLDSTGDAARGIMRQMLASYDGAVMDAQATHEVSDVRN